MNYQLTNQLVSILDLWKDISLSLNSREMCIFPEESSAVPQIKGDTHMMSTLRGEWGFKAKMRC